MLAIVLLNIIYGSTFTISKILLQFAPPLYVIGIRMTIAGSMLLAAARFLKKEKHRYCGGTVQALLIIGVLGIFVPYALRYWALGYMNVSKTALIYNISPFASFLFSMLLLGEKGSFKKVLGMLIGFCGIIPSILVQAPAEAQLDVLWRISWPEIAMIFSVSGYCLGWIVMKKYMSWGRASALWINGHTMLIGGILSLIASYFLEPYAHISTPEKFWPWLMLIMLLTNVITYQLYAYLLRRTSATLMSLGSLIAPISASVTSWLYFGETIGWDFFATLALVLLGFVIFYRDEIKKLV